MPTAKGKGGPASHRYRPASEYDDATLAQKREYWKIKKREQRARRSEQREKPSRDSPEKRVVHPNSPVSSKSSPPGSFAAFSSPARKDNESHKTATVSVTPQSRTTTQDSSVEATERQKEKWLQNMSLNKVLPRFPVKSLTAKGAGSRAVTSAASSETQLNTSSSVPPARVTTITNGSSTKTTPQPCVSMQGASVPKTQHKQAQVASCIHPKPSPVNVTTGLMLASPQSVPNSVKVEDTTAQGETKSALVSLTRTRGEGNSQPPLESEEEKAAKRREQWRIKKREQRAKVAARIAKARERTQGVEKIVQRQTSPKNGLEGGTLLQRLPTRPLVTRASQRPCPPRAKAAATVKTEADRIKQVQNLHENRTQKTINPDIFSVKKPEEAQRKLPAHVHLSNVSRGIARFKTHRQRCIEAQKHFMIQRSIRCKSTLLSSVFGSRNIPKIDPNDTPEQIIAKRREYWRIKKREQRAKLSMEMKTRLKEKDSLMRRVKRYQNILEEMRRARAQVQSSGSSSLTHASETIGGFIKEDGTVSVTIPQAPTEFSTAAHKSEKELHVVSHNSPITKPQLQPDTKRQGDTSIRSPPAILHPPQVKVSIPLSISKSPRPLSIRPNTRILSTGIKQRQTVAQLTLTHPPTLQNAVSGGSVAGSGGCVMKMTVSTTAPLLSLSSQDQDQGLTEEERMAKKREYWRIKKREQRAARAARLKLGLLQGRAMAVLQRRKTQKQIRPVPLSRRLTNHTGNGQPLLNNNVPVSTHTSKIKQESELTAAVDLNTHLEQAICPDIKPPTSPAPPPAPQPEPDPALNVDNQATTLLAVASMKKLLEESLSTVAECKGEQTGIKTEPPDEASEPQTKPNLSQPLYEKDEVSPIAAADLTLEIKSFQSDPDALVPAPSPNPHVKDSPRTNETPSPLSTSDDVVLHPTCEHSSQTDSSFIVNPSVQAPDGPYSPRRTQRLSAKKPDRLNSCDPEPPKLHHLPVDQLQPQNNNTPSVQRHCSAAKGPSGLNSLQMKREYWKLMKRQQRARSKARQRERQGESSSRPTQRNIQAPALVIINSVKCVNPPAKAALQPKPQVTTIPKVLTVTPTIRPVNTLHIKLPVNIVSTSSRNETNITNGGPSGKKPDRLQEPEDRKKAMTGPLKSASSDVDSSPYLPTLKPPENPLSSINLQPFEPTGQSPTPILSPIKIPYTQHQSPSRVTPPNLNLPVSTMAPPKRIPGESEEDFLKRKREYWRIKKKEQRARKAFSDKGTSQRRVSNNWRPIQPVQPVQVQVQRTQDADQWVSPSEEQDHLMSPQVNADQETFEYPSYTAPVEDEAELLFPDYENNNGEDGPVPDAVWRNRYLMDYDPLNQLLVCMVCGELQYSHSLEGVRAHIDEAHPDTLTLERGEQQRILEAWDEQVSRRERFFTSQLQQHSGALAEAQKN